MGSMARYAIRVIALHLGMSTTVGTFAANAIGSFLIGLFLSGISDKALSFLVVIGFLGGFTTFSTFSAESVTMIRQGETLNAVLYITATIAVCLLFTYLGMKLCVKGQ